MAEPGTGGGRRFRVIDVLGTGAFGTVYRAETVGGISRRVAVKVLHPHAASHAHVVQRLRDEARILARLKHRAFVRVDDLVQLDGAWAIVMELVDGVDLQRVSAVRPLPPGPALEVLQEVASALRVAWEQEDEAGHPLRLLHRDIKPSNLSLTPTGEVRVLDFGIARAELAEREAETRSMLLGTPAYMAPECFDDGPGHESDVFALGATLYELLTGEMLGRTSVDPERHAAHVDAALARVGWLPPEMVALLRDMLAYRASARPSAREVERRARALRPALGEPWLTDWAPEAVADVRALGAAHDEPASDGPVSGTLLEERGSSETFQLADGGGDAPIAAPRRRVPLLAWLAGGSALLGGAGLVAVALLWLALPVFTGRSGLGGGVFKEAPIAAPIAAPSGGVVDADPVAPEPDPEPSAPPSPSPTSTPPPPGPTSTPPPPGPTSTPPSPRPPPPTPPPGPAAVPVALTGPATASLVSGDATWPLPGPVPPGTYEIVATFPGRAPAGAGRLTVLPGSAPTVECIGGFFLCRAASP